MSLWLRSAHQNKHLLRLTFNPQTMSATLAPEDLAFMHAHASDNLKIDIIVCSAICGVASLVFILARLRSRMLSEARLGWSDWLVIIGYVSARILLVA